MENKKKVDKEACYELHVDEKSKTIIFKSADCQTATKLILDKKMKKRIREIKEFIKISGKEIVLYSKTVAGRGQNNEKFTKKRTKEEYPLHLSTNDLMEIMNLSRKHAYEIVNQVEAKINRGKPVPFPLHRVGKLFKIPRDQFFQWLENNAVNRENNWNL
jgi:hypothetical protein